MTTHVLLFPSMMETGGLRVHHKKCSWNANPIAPETHPWLLVQTHLSPDNITLVPIAGWRWMCWGINRCCSFAGTAESVPQTDCAEDCAIWIGRMRTTKREEVNVCCQLAQQSIAGAYLVVWLKENMSFKREGKIPVGGSGRGRTRCCGCCCWAWRIWGFWSNMLCCCWGCCCSKPPAYKMSHNWCYIYKPAQNHMQGNPEPRKKLMIDSTFVCWWLICNIDKQQDKACKCLPGCGTRCCCCCGCWFATGSECCCCCWACWAGWEDACDCCDWLGVADVCCCCCCCCCCCYMKGQKPIKL